MVQFTVFSRGLSPNLLKVCGKSSTNNFFSLLHSESYNELHEINIVDMLQSIFEYPDNVFGTHNNTLSYSQDVRPENVNQFFVKKDRVQYCEVLCVIQMQESKRYHTFLTQNSIYKNTSVIYLSLE